MAGHIGVLLLPGDAETAEQFLGGVMEIASILTLILVLTKNLALPELLKLQTALAEHAGHNHQEPVIRDATGVAGLAAMIILLQAMETIATATPAAHAEEL